MRVPEQLMRAMAAEAEAAREARAKVIAAEGEHNASRALRCAAEVISENPAALPVWNSPTFSHFSHFLLVTISANSEQHLSREQQHHYIPSTNRCDQHNHGRQAGKPCSRDKCFLELND